MSYGSYFRPALTGPSPIENDPVPSSVDLKAVLSGCARRWKLIIATPLLLLIATYGVLQIIPWVYKSTVQILVFDPSMQNASSIGALQNQQPEFDAVALNTQVEVIESPTLLQHVAEQLKLDEDSEFQSGSGLSTLLNRLGVGSSETDGRATSPFSGLLHWIGLADRQRSGPLETDPNKIRSSRIEKAATILRERISVDRIPLSYVLRVTASSHTPQMAQRLVSAIVNEYFAEQNEARRDALQHWATWLEQKLAETKTRIAETDNSIEKLRAKSGITDTGKGNLVDQQIADLDAQLMLIRSSVAEKRAQLEQSQEGGGAGAEDRGYSDEPSSASLTQLRVQQSLLAQREALFSSRLGSQHAETRAVAARLAGITRAINDEVARIRNNLKNSYQIALRREHSLEMSLQQLTEARGTTEYAKLQQLQLMADADNKLYDTYLSQINEAGSRQVGEISARLIAKAGLPIEPSFPKPLLFYVLAATLGLMLGVFLAALIEYLNPRLLTGAQAQRVLGCPVVGVIPFVRWRSALQTFINEPQSLLAASVRTIRTVLHLSNPGDKVVLVTSCLPNEGKTTLASVLAAASARAGLNTVLVDCDLRRPAIGQEFGKPGMTEVLAGIASVSEVIYRDARFACFVIQAGADTKAPEELLTSSHLSEVIDYLRLQYDFVIIDTPPILSVVDALAIVPFVDRVLLTVDSEKARRNTIAHALRRLGTSNRYLVGLVFNKARPSKVSVYQYGGYSADEFRLPALAELRSS